MSSPVLGLAQPCSKSLMDSDTFANPPPTCTSFIVVADGVQGTSELKKNVVLMPAQHLCFISDFLRV